MRYEMAVRLCGVAVILGLAACGPRAATREGQAEPRDSVALGYGSQAATNVTGSVSSVDPNRNQAFYTSMAEYLQAQVAGLQVVRRGGGDIQLVVRGGKSTFGQADNSALLVIDDKAIPPEAVTAQLNSLRPEDVRRVDVVKDASAAIYGSRGANGVVIITTKHTR